MTDAAASVSDTPAGALRRLVLALMSRLMITRGFGALCEPDGLRVVAVVGRGDLRPGEALGTPGEPVDLPPGPLAGADVPAPLRRLGVGLVLPLRHGAEGVGLVALGPRATGVPFSTGEVARALAAASGTAASVHALRAAAELAEVHRALAARAQALETLYELARAFGQALSREAVLKQLGFALMGQLLVPRYAVALPAPGGALAVADARGVDARRLVLPSRLLALEAPAALSATDLGGAAAAQGLAWAIPLRAARETRGVLLLGHRATGEPLGQAEAALAAALAALATGALETAERVEERLARERVEEEMRLARRIQERLLPALVAAPRGHGRSAASAAAYAGAPVPGLRLAARWQPRQTVSGDTFEWAPLPGGRLLVAVADVAGKGAPAALLMASVQAGLRLLRADLAVPEPDLAAATARLNALLCESTDASQFATLAWGVCDPAAGRLRYVCAGHPPVLVRRAGGAVEAVGEGGPLLGVLPGATFAQGETGFGPGDLLLFYTDGATEAASGAEAEFGEEGLAEALRTAPADPEAALGALVKARARFAGLADDLTLLAVGRDA
ncbi:MAG: PP2C family protein-serine/threonine phosphatase [Rubricoccaceae bacterium]